MRVRRKIELLSPARNADVGIVAVNHGADAVYIGAPQFGARQAVGNSLAEIARLVTYAHRFYARVYVALNTILTDDELEQARLIINELYNIGVDALIVQDMGLTELDLPPIPLHASTQCDNRTLEKVRFLEQCGFEQVVLARELSLGQIRHIADNTTVALECFVHGALCVSYSGQCYLSEALRQRSANRGACAQMCRLPYTLVDADGRVLAEGKHLLSLKDFDASAHLAELIEAGVSSFKIEGRLKDEKYVKNLTAYYRRKLDALLEGRTDCRASSGTTRFFFEPNPQKTFYRGATDYFLQQRTDSITSFDTPKSLGEPIGKVKSLMRNCLSVDSTIPIANGDGLCGVGESGELVGFRVNRAEQGRLFPLKMPRVNIGTMLYRNQDVAFEKLLSGKTAERKIAVRITVSDHTEGLLCTACDEDGNRATHVLTIDKMPANNSERAREVFRTQFAKLGDTDFELSDFQIDMSVVWFVPMSQIADARRALVQHLVEVRQTNFPKRTTVWHATSHAFPQSVLDYRANVSNDKAVAFYARHGARVVQRAFEAVPVDGAELMRTKHCLRYSFGWCPRQKPQNPPHEPLLLKCGSADLLLTFDCTRCEMVITKCR
ncbi:MAG: U32 family peptidase [Paludibacteraceae bacterium]